MPTSKPTKQQSTELMAAEWYHLYDDQWSSPLITLAELRAQLREYVEDCAEGEEQALALAILEAPADPACWADGLALVARINSALDSGTNSLGLSLEIDIQPESPVGPRVLSGHRVSTEDFYACLPVGWDVAEGSQVVTDSGLYSSSLVRVDTCHCSVCGSQVNEGTSVDTGDGLHCEHCEYGDGA